MKKNVLVFPCGSEIGLEIYRSLQFSTHFNIFGGSSVDDHGKFIYKNYISEIPHVDDTAFMQKLNRAINENNIDFIIPAHDSVVLKLAKEKENNNLNCELITSPLDTCEIVRSKLKTYEIFKDIIPVPKVYDAVQLKVENLPVFLKPNVGQGSKGTHLASTIEDVTFYIKKDPSLAVLEYLPGREYTVDCFTNKDGKLLFCEGRERNRISGGISVSSISLDDERFVELAEKINQRLKFRGVWFFQLKEREGGELVLMEIAPRVAGTMGLARAKGANLPLMSLFDVLGYEVNVFKNNYHIIIDRALENKYMHDIEYDHVYLDLDDTVILGEKVNSDVMAFVYQCINKKINLHLITKHQEVLEDTLKKYKLSGIFDELILLRGNEEKYLHIKYDNSIFIDDSFLERKKVHDNHGIPVFDSHMLEALMEKL